MLVGKNGRANAPFGGLPQCRIGGRGAAARTSS